jgi:tetratricopeptide (TPR) repeat protein
LAVQKNWRKFVLIVLAAFAGGPLAAAPEFFNADAPLDLSGNFDWSEFIQAPPPDADPDAHDDFAAFTEAMANDAYSEAGILAKQMVEAASSEGSNELARARALQNLAATQQTTGEYESARQNFLAAISTVSAAKDNLSPDLVKPLRGLAATYVSSQQPEQAFATYDKALHISNVNFGPHSLGQMPILQARLQLMMELDDPGAALDVLERIDMLYTRKFERYSAEMLPGLYLQAKAYGELGVIVKERNAWRHILSIKERTLADDDPDLIEPNIRLATIYMRSMRSDAFRAVSSSSAEKHLKNALRIANSSPDATWAMRKECLLSLADFYTLFDLKARARRYYGEAWTLLSANDELLRARSDSFDAPVPLSQPKPDRYAHIEIMSDYEHIEQDDYLEGEVTVRFAVDERGRTQELAVVAATPEDFTRMEIRARNAVDGFVYRPRFVDGQPVSTGDLEYRFQYYYLPSVYESALEKSAKRNRSWQSR